MRKNHKGVSAVISTIILLTVTITTSFSIAYWMGGICSEYTQIEKLEIVNSIVSSTDSGRAKTWTITTLLKNIGTCPVTITEVYINDKPLDYRGATKPPNPAVGNGSWYADSPIVASGSSTSFVMVVKNGGYGQPFTSLSPGFAVDLKLHSDSGVDYTILVGLS